MRETPSFTLLESITVCYMRLSLSFEANYPTYLSLGLFICFLVNFCFGFFFFFFFFLFNLWEKFFPSLMLFQDFSTLSTNHIAHIMNLMTLEDSHETARLEDGALK